MLSIIEKNKLKNGVQRVLHVPGNFTGPVLEMTVVLDRNLELEYISETVREVVATLKKNCGDVFRNVRLNVVWWDEDNLITAQESLARLQMSSFFDDYTRRNDSRQSRNCGRLMNYLKVFHGRSKLVIIISDDFRREETRDFLEAMKPFLEKKTLLIKEGICYDLHRDF